MADALCGPSNPLQNFQKQSSVDRSLQQDRFTARGNGPQGFRSGTHTNDGLLDPDFEAFKAGQPAALHEANLPPHLHQQPLHPQPPRMQNPSENAGWASDFQRLSFHPPQASGLQHPIQQQTPPSSWHQDFQQHQSPAFSHTAQALNYPSSNYSYQQPSYHTQPYSTPVHQNQSLDKGKARLRGDNIDAAALEREFEAHAREFEQESRSTNHLEAERDVNAHGMDSTQEKLDAVNQGAANIYQNYKDMQEQRDWNATAGDATRGQHFTGDASDDPIFERAQHEDLESQQDHDRLNEQEADELAETAGKLLSRVSDNTSQKFKESNFLAFMEKIRDRSVKVEGNAFVDVHNGDSTGLVTESINQNTATRPARGPDTNTFMTGALEPEARAPSNGGNADSGRRVRFS